jgi:hypothetical protein
LRSQLNELVSKLPESGASYSAPQKDKNNTIVNQETSISVPLISYLVNSAHGCGLIMGERITEEKGKSKEKKGISNIEHPISN